MRTWSVGIVGGGPGGLLTGYLLQNAIDCPLDLTIYEASDRLGGKIQTLRFQSSDARYEAGAAELYDYSPVDHDPLRELIADLGLSTSRMGGAAVIVGNEIIANLDDVERAWGPEARRALLTFDRDARDWMSPRDYFDSDNGVATSLPMPPQRFDTVLSGVSNDQVRRYLEIQLHSDLATEPAHTSMAYGLQNYLMNDPAYMELYCIAGGNEQLPRALAQRVSARWNMEHRVTEVGRDGEGRLEVTVRHSGTDHRQAHDFLVLALPHAHLGDLTFRGPLLQSAMARHLSHYNHPAHYLRISILFERPFWRNELSDSYWMLDQFGGCCLYDESSREPESSVGVLGWLLAGEAAQTASLQDDDQLIRQALDSLPAFLSHGRKLFLEGRVHRWLGAVSALPGGMPQFPLDQRHQPEPQEHPNLFVVGDYLFDSTLNGVLDSADYVSQWLAASIADSPQQST